jgi:hypothetical protein
MSARDELAKLLFQQNVSNAAAPTAPEIIMLCEYAADAILAAGYRKPRTITTEAELHALRDGSAVSAAGDVHIKNGRWMDRLGEFSPAWLLLEMGVVTIVYEEPSGE